MLYCWCRYEFDIRIPFWLAGPNISAGQVVETPVLSIDIAPTLLNLAGLTNSTLGMDGLSVAPLVTNTSQPGGGGAGERNAAGSAVLAATAGDTDPILNNYTGIQVMMRTTRTKLPDQQPFTLHIV